jgi:hypothetical protein
MKKAAFRDWTLTKLDKAFGLKQAWHSPVMAEWEAMREELTDTEKDVLDLLQAPLVWAGKAWNEVELANKFIGPLIVLTKVDGKKFGYFLERPLAGVAWLAITSCRASSTA